jgi:NAD(P)-dependent dehydrogenase (short-subunit alcohol dehydrogenase family)
VGKEESIELLRAACGELPEGPIGVIYNAACTKEDIEDGLRIRPDILGEINRAGISGLANTLQAFEGALLERGGLLTGISSFSALVPPATRGKLAYPATKAYMDMIMRTLGFLWKDRVRVLTIHLGLMKEEAPGSLPGRMLISTYQEAAERIIRAITSGRIPSELNYPWIYNVAYSGFLKHLPDFLYFPIMRGVSEVGPESKDRVQ